MTSASCFTSLTVFWLLSACLMQCRSSAIPASPGETSSLDDDGMSKRDVDQPLVKRALDYYSKVLTEYWCSSPQLRLVPVQRAYPSNSVSYTTDHVVLHQCAHDGGCCPPSETCSGNETEDVEIPILFVASDGTISAEMMTFTNHTTCHCVPMQKFVAS